MDEAKIDFDKLLFSEIISKLKLKQAKLKLLRYYARLASSDSPLDRKKAKRMLEDLQKINRERRWKYAA